MKKARYFILVATLVLTTILSACAAPEAATTAPAEEEAAPAEATTAPAEEEAADAEATAPAEEEAVEEADAEATAPAEEEAAAAGDASLPDLEGREITIAVENAYLPFNYIALSTGEPAGWDYDAIAAVCELLNCQPSFVEAAWDGMIQAVADGQYDMAADGITITPDRAEIVDFSNGYINIEQRVLVRIDEDRFTTTDELIAEASYLIGSQPGTTNYETAVKLVGDDRVRAFETFPFAVQALIIGDVDAVIIDETAGLGYVGVNADELTLIGESLSSDALGFIFPKGSDLVEPFNMALDELKANGTLDELAAQYFTDAFTITYDEIE